MENEGSHITGNVNTEGGDFVGRDQNVHGDKFSGDKVMGDKHEHHHYYAESHEINATHPPMMALAPPNDYIQRSKEFGQLINYLLAGNEKTVAITATIRGAGGFGKTTLAQAICHDQRIHSAFPDGILWITVGDDKANVLLGLYKLYHALTGRETQFVDQHDATTQLSSVLAGRYCLIVIDDVWNAAHLQPFLEGGERCARLVTTRIASVIPKEAKILSLDAMQVSEAIKLLGAGLENSDIIGLSQLARRLGEWPLLLKLVNRRLYEDVEQYGLHLADAITCVNEELNEFGLTTFDVNDAEERNQAVAASIGISLRHLKPDAQYGRTLVDEVERFLELAIFPEDTPIPLRTLGLLWQQTNSLSAGATNRLCRRLADLSLVLRYDIQADTILLHDVTRHYLLNQASMVQLVAWQRALLDGYRAQCNGKWWQLPNDGYLYQHLFWHLQEAQLQDTIEILLLTFRWLDAKLQATDIVSLIRDFDFRRDKQRHTTLSLLRHALQMSMSVLASDKDQLVSQLYGRLCSLGEQWEAFVDEIAKQIRVAWLQPKAPNLMRPGGSLIYTLSGHKAGISNLLLTPTGHLVSACSGRHNENFSIKVWDIEQGVLLHSLEGDASGVSNLLLTPNGRLISVANNYSSNDCSVKIWDIEQGILLHSLEGHRARINNLLLAPANRLISACNRDSSIKVWDIEQGILLHSLEGHRAGVSNLVLMSDNLLISTSISERFFGSYNSEDFIIKVWDIEQGILLHSLEGHTAGISTLLLTPDGRLISACNRDSSIKVWDIEQGILLHSLEGHTPGIDNLLLTPDGRLISAWSSSNFFSIKVWNIEQGMLLHSLKDHTYTGNISSLLLTPYGRLICACSSSIKVWNIEQEMLLHLLEGHTDNISSLLLTPNGRLISACRGNPTDVHRDSSIKVWDIEQGILLHSLEGHRAGISTLLLTPDGRLISACSWNSGKDYSVKVWDIEQGKLLHSLKGHIAIVDSLLLTPKGYLVSACGDRSKEDFNIKVWDIAQSMLSNTSEGHTDGVYDLLLVPNGFLVSSCGSRDGVKDNSIKIWSIEQGMLLHSLEGHTDAVASLLLASDGRLISSCEHSFINFSIKVWDIEQGMLLYSLEDHTACADSLLLTPDGRLISASSSNGFRSDFNIKVWDIDQGVLLHSLEGHTAGICNLLLTPDGRLISACSSNNFRKEIDSSVKVWDIEQGVLLHSLEGHTDNISNLLLTPDGRIISACNSPYNRDNSIKVWDIEQGILLHSLESHTDNISNLLLTPDGRLISACNSSFSRDSSIKVWDIEQGILLHSLEGHRAGIDSLLLTPDGRLISTCGNNLGEDYSVKIWNIEQGILLHSLEGHTDNISNLLLTPDGHLISASNRDNSIKVWDIEHEMLLYSLNEYVASINYMLISQIPNCFVTVSSNLLTIRNWHNGKKVVQFINDNVIRSCKQTDDGMIIVGDESGRVHFLRLVEP